MITRSLPKKITSGFRIQVLLLMLSRWFQVGRSISNSSQISNNCVIIISLMPNDCLSTFFVEKTNSVLLKLDA